MRGPDAISHRITDVGLTDVRVNPRTVWQHVRLTTTSGLTGLGEATLEFANADFGRHLEHRTRQLIGRDLADDPLQPLRQTAMDLSDRTILSALDQALMDLRAQIAGQSLCQFLGAADADGTLPLYANINRATQDRTPAGFAENAKAAIADGFQAIKVAPFDDLTPDLCGTPDAKPFIDAGLDRLRATREAIGTLDLMVDCHWRFTESAAQALIPALREIDIVWLECPLPETCENIQDLSQIRRTANRHGMRLCGLETAGGWNEVEPFITAGAYDLIMPDVKHAGGLTGILETARLAQAAGTDVSLHNPSGPIAHFFSVHVMAALDSGERLEIQWEESPLFYRLTDPPPVVQRGTCRPISGAGLGASLLKSAVALSVLT